MTATIQQLNDFFYLAADDPKVHVKEVFVNPDGTVTLFTKMSDPDGNGDFGTGHAQTSMTEAEVVKSLSAQYPLAEAVADAPQVKMY